VLLSPFMAIVSKVVILPFYMETFAFFIEAIFLGIYAYTWAIFKGEKGKWLHWLTSLPIVMAACASAFLITTVNAWMTAPQGFAMAAGGAITNVDQWKAMFNPAVPTRTGHSIIAYYATTAFVFAVIAAFHFIKNHGANGNHALRQNYYKKMLVFAMALAFAFSLAVVVTGDSAARYIAVNEPQKFAAAENVLHTGSDVPFVFGGVFDKSDALHGDIAVPGMLSFLLGGSEATLVKGLDTFDPSTWPPLWIHYLFDIMIVTGVLMFVVPLLFFAIFLFGGVRRKGWAFSRGMSWIIVVSGIASVIGVEAGWMFTEIGRQPYTITGVLLTQNAFTNSHAAIAYAVVFPLFYIILAIATFRILARHYRRDPIL
jgi:cytochrome d ubiquinol oxidase subunit I